MSSKTYAAPLLLKPGRPRRLFALAGGVWLGALLVLIFAPLPEPAALAGVAWLLLVAVVTQRRYFGSERIVEAVWKESGEWVLRQQSGRELSAQLASDTYFRSSVVILNFRARGALPPSLVLFHGEPDEQTHRRLRVRLRLHQAQPDEARAETLVQRASTFFQRPQ